MDLLSGVPGLEELISLKKRKHQGHWISLWRSVIGQKWDIVVDLKNSPVSRLIRARKRYVKSAGSFDPTQHVVIQNAQILELGDNPPPPVLWFTDDQKKKAKEMIPDMAGPVLGVGPTANFIGKMWPSEYFAELLKRVTEKRAPFEGYKIAIFGAPNEREQVKSLFGKLGRGRVIDLVGQTSTGEGAACLKRCRFFIGNDSGLMHCAAAVGVPTLGLFGPSRHENYAPWGAHCDYIRTPETRDELIGYEGFEANTVVDSMMRNLTVDMVETKITEMISDKKLAL